MRLQNETMALTFSDRTGGVTALEDRARGIQYISLPFSAFNETVTPVFRLDLGEGLRDYAPALADARQNGNDRLRLVWRTPEGITLTADICLTQEDARFTFRADNGSALCLRGAEYPLISGLRRIAGHKRDFLAHPYGTGLLVRDPYSVWTFDGQGLRYMPYPESFSGCSMQFFTYYGQDRGGLYFAAYDAGYHLKWLNFYCSNSYLEASHMAGNERLVPGEGIQAEYPFVIGFTAGEDWYEAADRYRRWALAQPWCEKGPLHSRPQTQRAAWLLEQAGACTFGVNAGSDRTPWLRRYRQDVGAPLFHVLGADWSREPQTYGFGEPGGYNDWVPTRFNQDNLRCIRRQGDRFAPFEFDLLADIDKDDGENIQKSLMRFPAWRASFDDYHFRILCPACAYTQDLHRRRDLQIMREAHPDAMYYDVSANNLLFSCLRDDHPHEVGGSTQIGRSFRALYADTKQALCAQEGKYIPAGTELMNEIFIGELDYYQARSWAQPCSSLEFWPVRALLSDGHAVPIPLFTYTYSQYAPLRMDGWGKMTAESGELFYAIAARVYLWGGLYEINQEFSEMEALDGRVNPPEEHYFRFTPRGYAYCPERTRYLRQFAALRTGFLNPYIAYGRMLPSPLTDAALVPLSYFHYNHGQGDSSYEEAGEARVEAVLTSAWTHPHLPRTVLLLANVTGAEQSVCLRANLARYGMQGRYKAALYSSFEPGRDPVCRALPDVDAAEGLRVPLTLKARTVYALTLQRDA